MHRTVLSAWAGMHRTFVRSIWGRRRKEESAQWVAHFPSEHTEVYRYGLCFQPRLGCSWIMPVCVEWRKVWYATNCVVEGESRKGWVLSMLCATVLPGRWSERWVDRAEDAFTHVERRGIWCEPLWKGVEGKGVEVRMFCTAAWQVEWTVGKSIKGTSNTRSAWSRFVILHNGLNGFWWLCNLTWVPQTCT